MADNSHIEWTNASWQTVYGCSLESPGCTNCYAQRMAGRLEAMGRPEYAGLTMRTKAGAVWNGTVRLAGDDALMVPLRWRKPRMIFVNSMSDLFHPDVPNIHIDKVFAVMALAPWHTFQVLTKRSARMKKHAQDPATPGRVWGAADRIACALDLPENHPSWLYLSAAWPLRNVWCGVSVEDRARLCRLDDLRATAAAVRFVSFEPILEDLGIVDLAGIHWSIAGCESGPRRRPPQIEAMRSLRDQCAAAGVAFYGKQIDKVIPLPPDLMVRQFPRGAA